jgi:hypothetical protein
VNTEKEKQDVKNVGVLKCVYTKNKNRFVENAMVHNSAYIIKLKVFV